MTEPMYGRWVLDTNVLISALLGPRTVPAQAFARALAGRGKLLVSRPTLEELNEVLFRPKFDRYLSSHTRHQFMIDLMPILELVPPSMSIRACRDPRDDKFLEVAVHGSANALVTGDADLLALHPFHGVTIITPSDFITRFAWSPEATGSDSGFTGLVQEGRAPYKARRKTNAPTVKV
jgi:putative PIN family toxin of toxin-antitoxin system